MILGTILLLVLMLSLIRTISAWPYSEGWSYGPSGGVEVVVLALLGMLLMARF